MVLMLFWQTGPKTHYDTRQTKLLNPREIQVDLSLSSVVDPHRQLGCCCQYCSACVLLCVPVNSMPFTYYRFHTKVWEL